MRRRYVGFVVPWIAGAATLTLLCMARGWVAVPHGEGLGRVVQVLGAAAVLRAVFWRCVSVLSRRAARAAAARRTLEWVGLSLAVDVRDELVRATLGEREVAIQLGSRRWRGAPCFEVAVQAVVEPAEREPLERALRALGVTSLRVEAARVVAVTRSCAGGLSVDGESDRLIRIAKRIIERTVPAAERLSVRARLDDETTRCPYCHDAVSDEASRVSCEKCGALHHRECFEDEHGACSVFGCGAPASRMRQRGAPVPT